MDCSESERKMKTLVYRVQDYLEENYNLNIPSECIPFVCRCLKQKKESVRKTANLIVTFQKVLADFDAWNCTLKPSLHNDVYTRENCFFNPLSQRDDQGRHVFLVRPEFWNPNETSFTDLITCFWMLLQYVNAYVENVQNDGWVAVWDWTNLSVEQGLAISPSKLLEMIKWAQNGTCGKMKAVHAINHPRIVDMLYAGCKPFLSDKFKARVFFHKNVESLLEHVPARILPPNLQGKAGEDSYRDKTWLYEIIDHDKLFEDMLTYGLPTK